VNTQRHVIIEGKEKYTMEFRSKTVFLIILISGIILCGGTSLPSAAPEYPEKPINAIIPFVAGGAPDLLFRPLSEIAQKHLGVPLVIFNKPAGGGMAGTQEVARAKPDGYTILMNFGGGEHLVSPHLEKVPFDTLKDFEPVIILSYYPSGLFVKEDSPWKNLEEIIEYAKKNPWALRYSHPGTATMNHLAALAFEKIAGISLSGIPTGGGGPALNMLLGGHVEAAQIGVPVAWPQVHGGQIRCLAYSLPKRSGMYPGAPTYVEKGYDLRFAINQGIAVPKGTPKEVVQKLHDAFALAFKEKGFQEIMEKVRFSPNYMNSEDTAKYIREMYQYYGDVIKKLGVTLKK
jgi:tripartite-type tricarboxylate transporter receptor subunit TctC